MAVANIKVSFSCSLKKVWETVTSLEKYQWRSDLSKIEVKNEKTFIEYTKDGYPTIFTVTVCEPEKRWEFNMDNTNMKGHWSGVFTQQGEQCMVDFTEDVTAKKTIMKPFLKSYLKKQQAQYVADLQKVLG